MLVESLGAASMLVESLDAAVLVEPDSAGVGPPMQHLYTLAEKTSGLLQPVLEIYSTGRPYTRIQQEVFPRTVGPACRAMYVVHRQPAGRHVPTCRTWCER